MDKKDIKNFTLKEIEKTVVEIEEPAYRAGQIFRWLYKKGVCDFDEMSNLPQSIRSKLNQHYYIGAIGLSEHLVSTDEGAEKFLFNLADGNFIETVLIHAKKRKTVCLSTQVGCPFACPFCASGRNGFVRDLTPAEITNQILFLQHHGKHKITNYVFMGMGEPLDNYANVSKAIMIMNTPEGMDIGARRITVSTCGIIPGIEKIKDLGLQVNLSVSIHAVHNNLRDVLVPVNKRYPLEELIKACQDFINKTGRMITLEYVLIRGKNDSLQDAAGLAAIARKLKARVNLIPLSPISGSQGEFKVTEAQMRRGWMKPTRITNRHKGRPGKFELPGLRPMPPKEIDRFRKEIMKSGVNVTLRESRGKDIQAACGQLAGRAI